jgi:serine protease Do/serine protease DegQ
MCKIAAVACLWGAAALVTVTAGVSTAAAAQIPPVKTLKNGVPTLAPLLKRITPAVVNIAVKTKTAATPNPMMQDPFFRFFFEGPEQKQKQPQVSAGSGVIIDAEKGFVLTNHHVIDNAEQIVVTLKDQRNLKAKLIGSDKGTDIALLQIEAKDLTALKFGNSDALDVGDFVLAIGNPFGIGQTVTSGIVSALGRSGLKIEGYEDFIQTDASINPGNSGGALVNLNGELIGINTAIIGPGGGNVGIGFAVPVTMARAVMHQLLRYGEVRRGRLGVSIQDITPDLAEALRLGGRQGAIISRVDPDSPAARVGVRAGDVILSVNGKALRNASDLRNRVGLVPVGETVDLVVIRNGKRLEYKVKIDAGGAVAAVRDGQGVPFLEGAVITNLDKDHGLFGKVEGVMVSRLEPGSPAWRHGLRLGDVIIGVNQEATPHVNAFQKAVEQNSKVLALNIIRGGTQLFLVMQAAS